MFDGEGLAFSTSSARRLFLFAQRLPVRDFQHAPDFSQAAVFFATRSPRLMRAPCTSTTSADAPRTQTKRALLRRGDLLGNENLSQLSIRNFGNFSSREPRALVVLWSNYCHLRPKDRME
ncbi:MAG: hypothetical protein IPJ99_00405 [Betaproteobacteria bacterium]|nr:hypothetical protein [Betaproteobacteria bacterium]